MIQPSIDRLSLLYRVSQTFNSTLDLDQVLNAVMDEVIAATRAERGFLMLRDAGGNLVFHAARGMDQRTIDDPGFQVSRGVVDRVAEEGRPLLTSNAQSDTRLGRRESVMLLGLRAILCVPLQFKGSTLGVIYVDNRLQSGIFTPSDLELLTSIASSAATAIENARLYQVAVDKGRLERELQVAREVQASLLPRETPRIPGWDFAAKWQPAREVAGDFFDFINLAQVAERESSHGLGVVIADVSDKGMPAALFMALSRSIVRASITGAHSPAEGIAQANRLICADAVNGMFVSLFYAQIDPPTGEMVYVNAGHNPPYLYRANQSQPIRLDRTGMLLGIDDAVSFEQRSVHLGVGDFVVLYTDGVTEAIDAQQREFGEERLQRSVLDHRHASAEGMVQAIQSAVDDFAGSGAPFDDVTLVIAKRL